MSTATKAISETVELTKIRVRVDHEYADVFYSERTGQVMIMSSFGHWSHYWARRHIGAPSVARFLAELDSGYAGGKLLGAKYMVYDHARTKACIEEFILECRRDGGMTKGEARAEWEKLDILDDFGAGEFAFGQWYLETTFSDPEVRSDKPDQRWQAFWDQIWEPWVRPALAELGRADKRRDHE